MFAASPNTITKTTTYKVVLPFYAFAAISFLVATVLLVLSSGDFTQHYFHPHILAITHIMTLGWGTMIILGASHQLVPVLIEGALYSNVLAMISFILAAAGIPLMVYGFYFFKMGAPALCGGTLIVLSIIAYLVNLALSMANSQHENVQAYFIFTAALWLLATTVVGLLLVYNFTRPLMPNDSLHYLALHAHIGIAGWFLLLITGVGSRLIPMFVISKYESSVKLWWIYGLINTGLLAFVFLFLYTEERLLLYIPFGLIMLGILLFASYCYTAYKKRIRKKVDAQMRLSFFSIGLQIVPLIIVLLLLSFLSIMHTENIRLILLYGFVIFFGWITAIILGMTFKTLPFIIWNKIYHGLAGKLQPPSPKDLFSNKIFKWMTLSYIAGFLLFAVGILLQSTGILSAGALLLLATAVLYNWNVLLLFSHKPVTHG